VLGSIDTVAKEVARRHVDEVVVQSGLLTGKRFRKLIDDCADAGANVKVLPGIDELMSVQGDLSHVRLRSVEIKDLLRREPVQLDDTAIRVLVEGRTVMITGAGGSIG
jgi:FlaA1/EpsC-like NDP-sugar epimerase